MTAVVARITKRAKILSLGTLVTVRQDPVRVAEEYATLDVLSKGRLQIGFVKSGGTEMASGDANPIRLREREWEAIDLIEKALTSHDGPFSWEGEFFTHPHVNIWPRPWQQPRPDFWAATSDLPTCAELGRRGMVNTLLFGGYDKTKLAFDAYKRARAEAGLPPPGEDRFAYLGFCYVGDTDEEALRVGQKIAWFVTVSLKASPQYNKFLPGQIAPEAVPKAWRGGTGRAPTDLRAESLVAARPDVRRQPGHGGAADQGVPAAGGRPRRADHDDASGAGDPRRGREELQAGRHARCCPRSRISTGWSRWSSPTRWSLPDAAQVSDEGLRPP